MEMTMRLLGPVILGLLAAACAGGPASAKAPEAPPAVGAAAPAPASAPTAAPAPPRQAPPATGPAVSAIGWVSSGDQLSIEQIGFVCAAHGVHCGMEGGNGYTLTVPESQAAFAAEVLRAEGPRLGDWGLMGSFGEGLQQGTRPAEKDWPVLASGISYDEALARFPETTPAGAVLRAPVTRAYARAFPRLVRMRGFPRPYRDAALAEHLGLEGVAEFGVAEGRTNATYSVRFQSCEGGKRIAWTWWYVLGDVPEPDAARGPWTEVARANRADPRSVEWILATLDAAGIAAFPLPEQKGRERSASPDRYAVPSADAARAKKLLRGTRPEGVNANVVGE
jgi:hypothetical protein